MSGPKPKVVTVDDSRSIVGRLLGDSLTGSCWRAVEQASKPDVEVYVYVRSYAEADTALVLILGLADKRGLIPTEKVDYERAKRNARALGAVVAVELNNGSVIALKREEGT
jgi:hypothetical protein